MQGKFSISQLVFWFCIVSMQTRSFKIHNINLDDKETSILYCGPESDKVNQEISEDLLATTPLEAMQIAKEKELTNRAEALESSAEKIRVITELQISIQ